MKILKQQKKSNIKKIAQTSHLTHDNNMKSDMQEQKELYFTSLLYLQRVLQEMKHIEDIFKKDEEGNVVYNSASPYSPSLLGSISKFLKQYGAIPSKITVGEDTIRKENYLTLNYYYRELLKLQEDIIDENQVNRKNIEELRDIKEANQEALADFNNLYSNHIG